MTGCAVPTCGFVGRVDGDAGRSATARTTSFTVTEVTARRSPCAPAVPAAVARHRRRLAGALDRVLLLLRRPGSSVLHRYDGDSSDVPAIDDVVAMEVRYYGGTQPPLWPRPPAGEANCLYDAAGAYQCGADAGAHGVGRARRDDSGDADRWAVVRQRRHAVRCGSVAAAPRPDQRAAAGERPGGPGQRSTALLQPRTRRHGKRRWCPTSSS